MLPRPHGQTESGRPLLQGAEGQKPGFGYGGRASDYKSGHKGLKGHDAQGTLSRIFKLVRHLLKADGAGAGSGTGLGLPASGSSLRRFSAVSAPRAIPAPPPQALLQGPPEQGRRWAPGRGPSGSLRTPGSPWLQPAREARGPGRSDSSTSVPEGTGGSHGDTRGRRLDGREAPGTAGTRPVG